MAIYKSLVTLFSNALSYNISDQTLHIHKDNIDLGIEKIFFYNLKKAPSTSQLHDIQVKALKTVHKISKESAEYKDNLQQHMNQQIKDIKVLYEKLEEQMYDSSDIKHLQRKADKALNDLLHSGSNGGLLSLIFDVTRAYGLSSQISSLNGSLSKLIRKVSGPEKATLNIVDFELSNSRTAFVEIFSTLKNNINIQGNRDLEGQKDAVKHLIKFYNAFEDIFYNIKNLGILNEINKNDLLLGSSLKNIIETLDINAENPDIIRAQSKNIVKLNKEFKQNYATLKKIADKSNLPALHLDSYTLFYDVDKFDFGYMVNSRFNKSNPAKDALDLLNKSQDVCKNLTIYSNNIEQYINNPSSVVNLAPPTGFWNGVCGGFRGCLEIFGEGFTEFFMGEPSAARQLDRLAKRIEKVAEKSAEFDSNSAKEISHHEQEATFNQGYNYPNVDQVC